MRLPAAHLDAVYVAYWSLADPLCQSQVLTVIDRLAASGWRLGLLTFEQARWRMAAAQATRARDDLASRGIHWVGLPYHHGLGVFSKAMDVFSGAFVCARLAGRSGARLIHGRGTVAGTIGCAAARWGGHLFFNDADSPISAEYVDAGLWRTHGWLQRFTRWMETSTLARADAIAVLTSHRRQEILAAVPVPVDVLPCGVDTNHFCRDPARGEIVKHALGLKGTVFTYVGKTGGRYKTDRMFAFLSIARHIFPQMALLVLTPDDPRLFHAQMTRAGLTGAVRFVDRSQTPAYLSAADVGLSLIAPTPSEASASPIKNGEYLACGLPIVTTPRIGDYSDLIMREQLGVTVGSEEESALLAAATQLRELLNDPGLRARCRSAAERHVSLDGVVFPRYDAIYSRLLTAPRLRLAESRQ
jgi:glycosyltransferase involved in cell wall biosynthesis